MSTAFAAVLLCCTGARSPGLAGLLDHRVKAIAPFVDSSVFAVIQVDVTKLDVEKLSASVLGDTKSGVLADGKKMALHWSEGLKAAGAKELFVVFSIIDMPGQPFVVVPLAEGAQADGIARTIGGRPALMHNAIVSGTPESARADSAKRAQRPPGRSYRLRSVPSAKMLWPCAFSFCLRPIAGGSSRRSCRDSQPKSAEARSPISRMD